MYEMNDLDLEALESLGGEAMPEIMSLEEVARAVELFATEAREWDRTLAADRIRAIEYYDGIMVDTPSDAGRSSVVSRDFRSATKKVLPAITRTILGSDEVVEFLPVSQGDEQGAEQATEYLNYVVLPECAAHEGISDSIHDALRGRNGILHWYWDDRIEIKFTRHCGLNELEFIQLAQDESVEVLEYGVDPSKPEGANIECRIKRVTKRGLPRLVCLPREEFIIHPDAVSIDEAPFCAWNRRYRRYELVAMGYDPALVDRLSAYSGNYESDVEESTRRSDFSTLHAGSDILKQNEEIDWFKCYVRLDADGDGYAELRRIVMAGGFGEDNILENEEVDEIPFGDIVIERRPHEWQGRALFDDIDDVQRVKTVLLRNTLDNIYWQNNQQKVYDVSRIQNPEALMNPKFGEPIFTSAGADVRAVVGHVDVPFVAAESFKMLGYMDEVVADRTGITDATAGFPADALQNVTAKASAMLEQQGIGQVELMVANVAVGLKRAFKGILKLVIQYQDKPRTVRLRDKWVEYDPRSWNSGMDVTVNTGLGAGTRERDMAAMGAVMQMQEKIIGAFGEDNPFVKPDNLYASASKFIQSAGLRDTSQYITNPDPQEVQQRLEAARNKPDPEMAKLEASMTLEREKIAGQQAKEQAQMQADVQVKAAELEKDVAVERVKAEAMAAAEAQRIDFEREKFAAEYELRREELAIKREELALRQQEVVMRQANAENEMNMKREDAARADLDATIQSMGNEQ